MDIGAYNVMQVGRRSVVGFQNLGGGAALLADATEALTTLSDNPELRKADKASVGDVLKEGAARYASIGASRGENYTSQVTRNKDDDHNRTV